MNSSTDGLALSPTAATSGTGHRELRHAVLCAVAYSDVFDYPLTSAEIYRYLAGVRTDLSTIDQLLANGSMVPDFLSRRDGYLSLPGREHLVDTRRERAARSSELWRHAMRYGALIAQLPFVRMVAITGELAVNNARGSSDIDYFIVTEPGRLWSTRAMVILLVKIAARHELVICPNYLVTENALEIESRNLYTAREMAQMVPLYGLDVYERIRQENTWVLDYLPNAFGPPQVFDRVVKAPAARRLSEAILRNPVVDRLESWEMTRKIRRFTREMPVGDEAAFSADWCKGHFDAHGEQTLRAYTERLRLVEELMQ